MAEFGSNVQQLTIHRANYVFKFYYCGSNDVDKHLTSIFRQLSVNVSKVNEFTCNSTNRKGYFCADCKKDNGIAVYRYYGLHCKNVRVISTLAGLTQLHLFRDFYSVPVRVISTLPGYSQLQMFL